MNRKGYLKSGAVSEEYIQKSLIDYVRTVPKHKNHAHLILHIANEGKRTSSYGKLLKTLGMRPGVADIFIAMPRNGYHGAWIELKSAKGKLSASQMLFLNDMFEQGYFTATAYSIDDAMKIVDEYCLG